MKLGVWPRLIIVVSCFWMIGDTFYNAQQISNEADAKADAFYKECEREFPGGNCLTGRDDVYRAQISPEFGLWGFAASEAGILLILALVGFGITYGSARWIMRGRIVVADDTRLRQVGRER